MLRYIVFISLLGILNLFFSCEKEENNLTEELEAIAESDYDKDVFLNWLEQKIGVGKYPNPTIDLTSSFWEDCNCSIRFTSLPPAASTWSLTSVEDCSPPNAIPRIPEFNYNYDSLCAGEGVEDDFNNIPTSFMPLNCWRPNRPLTLVFNGLSYLGYDSCEQVVNDALNGNCDIFSENIKLKIQVRCIQNNNKAVIKTYTFNSNPNQIDICNDPGSYGTQIVHIKPECGNSGPSDPGPGGGDIPGGI